MSLFVEIINFDIDKICNLIDTYFSFLFLVKDRDVFGIWLKQLLIKSLISHYILSI